MGDRGAGAAVRRRARARGRPGLPTTAATWTPPARSTCGATPASASAAIEPGRHAQPGAARRRQPVARRGGGGDRHQPQLRGWPNGSCGAGGADVAFGIHDKPTRVMRRRPTARAWTSRPPAAWWPAATAAARSRAARASRCAGAQRAGPARRRHHPLVRRRHARDLFGGSARRRQRAHLCHPQRRHVLLGPGLHGPVPSARRCRAGGGRPLRLLTALLTRRWRHAAGERWGCTPAATCSALGLEQRRTMGNGSVSDTVNVPCRPAPRSARSSGAEPW